MRILVIGGTSFVGPYTVRVLVERGHDVTIFTRGNKEAKLPSAVKRIKGDRQDIASFKEDFECIAPDVVVDMIPFRQADARSLMETMSGICPRVVGLSSIDVYVAFGRVKRTEPGPLQPVPLTEDAELRSTKEPHGLDYDKTGIEQEIMGDPKIAGTILRLPAIHGPGDYQHRLYRYLKRMDDIRPAILLNSQVAGFRFSRGYVENVATAVALAATDDHAAGRIYNVAEPEAFAEAEWVRTIGRVVGWEGEVVIVSPEQLPEEDDLSQDWIVDTYRIRQELGYHEEVSREVGLERTIDWERANPPSEIQPSDYDYAAEDEILKEH